MFRLNVCRFPQGDFLKLYIGGWGPQTPCSACNSAPYRPPESCPIRMKGLCGAGSLKEDTYKSSESKKYRFFLAMVAPGGQNEDKKHITPSLMRSEAVFMDQFIFSLFSERWEMNL